jgi:phage/plasmid-associated DNA primase
MQLINFVLPSLSSTLNGGHINASDLQTKILTYGKREGYYCLFDLEPRDSFKEYRGIHAPALGYFVFDFDSSEDISNAKADLETVIKALHLEPDTYKVFFSGNKGFHLYIRHEFFSIDPSERTAKNFERIACDLGKALNLETLDDSIYQANRKFRIPNSVHQKTGLFKIEIDPRRLESLTVDEIKNLAKTPQKLTLFDYSLPTTKYKKAVVSNGAVALNYGLESVGTSDLSGSGDFATFTQKVCIDRMLNSKHKEGMRHDVALTLISEFFHRGLPQPETLEEIEKYCQKQGILERFEKDYKRAIHDIYNGGTPYKYGCYSKQKQKFCSGTCGLYSRLDPSKRAEVSDLPAPSSSLNLVSKDAGESVPTKKGKQKDEDTTPSHFTVVRWFLKEYEGKIIKQDKDIFLWKTTHWEEASSSDIDKLKKVIHAELQFTQSDKLEKCFKLLFVYLPSVPRHINMFEPNPSVTNFKNGTLWVHRTGNEYSMEFKPHSKEDYLTHCLDLEYTEGNYKEGMFHDYLERLLSGDEEKEDKIRALKQLAGAMLVPVFPQIFFLLGKAGSGKSTFVKIYYHLIGGSGVCSVVEPKDMKGFLLESVLHKTVNIHTDVDENQPIPDSVVKTITDRIPVLINRKGKKAVQAYMPAVNAFCANTLPPTKVRDQKVYDRRMTVIQLNNPVKDSKMVINFEELIIKEDKDTLISFAIEGLKDLIASGGKFFKPASSMETTIKWQEKSSDVIQDFITAVSLNEVENVTIDEKATSNRNDLFSAFCIWSVAEGFMEGKPPVSRSVFYREFEARGFKLKKVDGQRLIQGIGVVSEF